MAAEFDDGLAGMAGQGRIIIITFCWFGCHRPPHAHEHRAGRSFVSVILLCTRWPASCRLADALPR